MEVIRRAGETRAGLVFWRAWFMLGPITPETKHPIRTRLQGILAVVTVLIGATPCTQAQYNPFLIEARGSGPRAGRMDFYGLGQYSSLQDFEQSGMTVNDPVEGLVTGDIVFRFDDSWSGGIGIAYHLNDYFALSAEFVMGYTDYEAQFLDSRLTGTMFQSTGSFNVDYNILPTPLTPFVSAGLGYYFQDTGLPSGPPGYYCWWDYYWAGWVCTGYVPTYTDTYFTLNAQGGLRWDINDFVFVRLWGGATWLDVGRGAGWPVNLQGSFALGLKF